MERGLTPLNPNEFEDLANTIDTLIIDTRKPEIFRVGFIPRSIFIGIDGDFAPWVGTLVRDIQQEILIVADEGREEEVVKRLARVGYDNVLGYLKGGFEAWKAAEKEMVLHEYGKGWYLRVASTHPATEGIYCVK